MQTPFTMTQHLPICHLLRSLIYLQRIEPSATFQPSQPPCTCTIQMATFSSEAPDPSPLIPPDIQSQCALITELWGGFILERKLLGTNYPRATHSLLLNVIGVGSQEIWWLAEKVPGGPPSRHYLPSFQVDHEAAFPLPHTYVSQSLLLLNPHSFHALPSSLPYQVF